MRAPRFWRADGRSWPAVLLTPFGEVTRALTGRRVARPGWRAPVPVICCGNVTLGGSGKTTLALDLTSRLARRGLRPHCLLRGFGGRVRGVRQVRPDDTVSEVGDEALLLAALAPTWIGADRAASARAAISAGADALVMDDGLQNPTLQKTMTLLVVDGGFGFGNGRLLPAGPLREPLAAGVARCQAAVLIGADETCVWPVLASHLPVLRAALEPLGTGLAGRRVFGFAGIGRPQKFFTSLVEAGATLVGRMAFPDHHRFTPHDLGRIEREATRLDALAVTTAKDAVRLPAAFRARVGVLRVGLAWAREAEIETVLDAALSAASSGG
ncbi:MAG: tetraacyldisaccharide 4'-kinase [Acetobacteraceae bacterium]|nr:tetraacyldisaccharide 4'-kinase [Acetobacteraceae bacterium]